MSTRGKKKLSSRENINVLHNNLILFFFSILSFVSILFQNKFFLNISIFSFIIDIKNFFKIFTSSSGFLYYIFLYIILKSNFTKIIQIKNQKNLTQNLNLAKM